jgi:hypothetical protein
MSELEQLIRVREGVVRTENSSDLIIRNTAL